MAGPADADADALEGVYDRLNDLVAALKSYQDQVRAERAAAPENEGLRHLLGLQLDRVERLLDYLDREGDETLRDMIDRQHVIREARAGRFN